MVGRANHFYPTWEPVQTWIADPGLVVEGVEDGDFYRHVIARRR